ncbi:unnamed protein product [Lymnaea stagnalis]|uniref:Poly [ADP-ribose] polymerase n=1 Tax=Lymnaea stagnalis TaxID=6523 RepID=A0AAV2HY36_LYMST
MDLKLNLFVSALIALASIPADCDAASTTQPPPARGTDAFVEYASTLDVQPPSYWTQQSPTNWSIVDVDQATKDAISALVDQTWDQGLIGKGDDGRNLNQTRIKVTNVKRIENPKLFNKYGARRQEILNALKKLAPRVASLNGSRGDVSTSQNLPKSITDQVYTEVNEHYFFHGTKVRYVNLIAENGFNMSVAGLGQFGRGIYGAERSTKSDQYTDATGPFQNMLLVRMTLGNVYLCRTNETRLLIRNASLPPTKDDTGNLVTYNSVMSDFKDDVLGVFREFIIYNETQFYPEYVIEYVRMSSAVKVGLAPFTLIMLNLVKYVLG